MTTEQIIRQNADKPIGQGIAPIVSSLAKHSVFLATDDETPSQPTRVKLNDFSFKTGKDNEGRTWAYAYTSPEDFSRAFPQGGPYIELGFAGFFSIIEKDLQYAGIFLNSASDSSCPIPREFFEKVKEQLESPRNN